MTTPERRQLIKQLDEDVVVLETKYRSYMPMEATRAIHNVARLCALLDEAVSELERERGSKAG